MSEIQSYVDSIRNARFGVDVRESIALAIAAIDDVATTSQSSAYSSAESAKVSRNAAESAATRAVSAAEQAMATTPEGYAELVAKVDGVENYNDRISNSEGCIENLYSVLCGSGKNMLKINATNTTKNGVTYEVKADGTVLTNGESTDYTYLKLGDFKVEAGKSYRISGCPSGGDRVSGYFIFSQGSETLRDEGEGVTFTASKDEIRDLYIAFRKGVAAIPRMWYPMVTLASVTDQTFEKYTDSVDTKIAEKIAAISEGEWITLELSEGFTQDANNPVRIRKIGKLVEINGLCHPSTDDGILGNATKVQLGQLPVGYRPSSNVDVLQKGSGFYTWLATAQAVSSGGKLHASCYCAGDTYTPATSTSNLYVHMMYSVD